MAYELSSDQSAALISLLTSKLGVASSVCRECGSARGFELARQLFELREYVGPSGKSPNFVPHALLQCTNCGHSRLFDALKLGVVDSATGRFKI